MAYNRSVFPEGGFDTFIELVDLPPERVQDAERYQTLKKKSNKTPQEIDELNNLTVSMSNYIMTPEKYNKLGDAITGTQQFFNNNVQGYIELKQDEFQSKIDSFDDVGEYNPATRYYKNNMFRCNGLGYIVLVDSVIGVIPTDDGVHYRQFTIKGEQGVSGSGLSPRGQYSGLIAYTKDDLVIYDNKWWVATQSTFENVPNTASLYWSEYLDLSGIEANGIIVDDSRNYYGDQNLELILQQIGENIIEVSDNPPINKLFWIDTTN